MNGEPVTESKVQDVIVLRHAAREALLLIFFYPVMKKRYGDRVWNALPHPIQLVARGLKIIGLGLYALSLVLVGLSMPLLLALACINLWIDNYNLRKELEKKDILLGQASS